MTTTIQEKGTKVHRIDYKALRHAFQDVIEFDWDRIDPSVHCYLGFDEAIDLADELSKYLYETCDHGSPSMGVASNILQLAGIAVDSPLFDDELWWSALVFAMFDIRPPDTGEFVQVAYESDSSFDAQVDKLQMLTSHMRLIADDKASGVKQLSELLIEKGYTRESEFVYSLATRNDLLDN